MFSTSSSFLELHLTSFHQASLGLLLRTSSDWSKGFSSCYHSNMGKHIAKSSSLTPGTPRFTARRLENKEDKVSVNAEDHETYRSGVGTLLYLMEHSRPDISNPVRELSKTMDAPAPAHLKEMYKLSRFVLSTKDYGLKFKLIKSIRKWVLKAFSDSDFASDKETRIRIF